MRLVEVQVTNFQSVRDSTPFKVDDITCLVDKNESGKTALLKAIYRLNAINDYEADYSVTDDYPRSDMSKYRRCIKKGEPPDIVVKATFALEENDITEVTSIFGPRCLTSNNPTITLCKGYNNETTVKNLALDTQATILHLIESADLPESIKSSLTEVEDIEQQVDYLEKANSELSSASTLLSTLKQIQEHGLANHVYKQILKIRIPKLLYFDEYYQLKGQENLEALKQRKENKRLHNSDHPLLGLIDLAGLDLDELQSPRRTEELIAKLEAAENDLTQQALIYWSQNRHLRLKFDVRLARPDDPSDMTTGTNIWGRVEDTKHNVSTPLCSRSKGFIWFFSFLAWYSQLREENDNLILLLDEPGLSLHAKAQADLLQYFEKELEPHHQVIYTTHSPFMVDPLKWNRVRIVQDLSIEDSSKSLSPDQEGTKVTSDVLKASDDSLFPLQAALGYDICQTLFIGPNCLVVEGTSDLLYMQAISSVLQSDNRTGLSSDWTIIPAGGLSKVSTFVALIGSQSNMNIAVLLDYHCKDRQAINSLFKRKLIESSNVLTYADFVSLDNSDTKTEADIEDMLTPDFYLELVNKEFGASIKPQDLAVSKKLSR